MLQAITEAPDGEITLTIDGDEIPFLEVKDGELTDDEFGVVQSAIE